MGADWGPIFSGIIIAICLIIAIPFIDIEETDGTYKEEILQESLSKYIGVTYWRSPVVNNSWYCRLEILKTRKDKNPKSKIRRKFYF